MAALIDMSNDRANFAYAGQKAWHGLGSEVNADDPLEIWADRGGFNWEVVKSPVQFLNTVSGEMQNVDKRFVLHRSDTGAPLSVMSGNYRVTQPKQVLEFFRDLVDAGSMKMETVGMLRGGATYWALARLDDSFDVGGGDVVLPYLLLATSCDGTLSNLASFTTVRVVCNNTLSVAVGKDGAKAQVRMPHSTDFDQTKFKQQLGLAAGGWERFKKDAVELSKREISREEMMRAMLNILYPNQSLDEKEMEKRTTIAQLVNIYENGVGQNTATAKGTAFGLVNAFTRWSDFERKSGSQDNRLQSAWFGSGATYKARAYDEAMALLAA